MDRASVQWTKTPNQWQATIGDTTRRVWEVIIYHERTSIRRPVTAAMLSQERAVGSQHIGSLYKSNSTFHTFTEAEAWIYETLGIG